MAGAQIGARGLADHLIAAGDGVTADLGARPALDDDIGALDDGAAVDRVEGTTTSAVAMALPDSRRLLKALAPVGISSVASKRPKRVS